ncbi:retrotransposon protein, putative, ty3-gypsy subclass [Tanacetum coccineum]|uniref:Retrotransposon protein, putative, ty3-gypsy subclass n=1 Tax=Tanacetum coccineum TaxID=301880 RepID=A0ABQ5E5U4_9ASTR
MTLTSSVPSRQWLMWFAAAYLVENTGDDKLILDSITPSHDLERWISSRGRTVSSWWPNVQNVEDGKHTEFSVDDDGVRVVKIEHQRASGLLQPLEIPMWKWDEISMDFVTGLPTTQKRHDAIWVVVDRLTKSAHFLPIRNNYDIKIRSLRLVFGKDYKKLGELVLSSVQHFILRPMVNQRGPFRPWKIC